jgi:putative transposase
LVGHKRANVLAVLPKSAHPGGLAALKEIYDAEDIDKAQVAIKAFETTTAPNTRRALAKITTPTYCSSSTSIPPSTGFT